MIASERTHLDTVKYLIEKGADVNLRNVNGNTALLLTVRYNISETFKYLIEKGADVNVRNAEGNTALMIASESNLLDTVKFLIEKGADVNLRNVVSAAFTTLSGSLI
eukprot:GHVR01011628.1.p2 GENE.GHVR01011628.1~~GHVR01011628.1.p2  ORF type:complete len:107 (+),score=13.94 GHVR01011628.1:524-844(+)